MPMKGASLCSSLSARSMRSLSIAARRSTASSRDGGSSSRWRQRSSFHTSAFERSGVFFWFVRTMPARMLVPPMSTAEDGVVPGEDPGRREVDGADQAGLVGMVADRRELDVDAGRLEQHRGAADRELADAALAQAAADHDALGVVPALQAQEAADHGRELLGEFLDRAVDDAGRLRVALDEELVELLLARSRGSASRRADPRRPAAAARANRRGSRGRRGCWRGRRRSPPRRAARRCSCRRRPTAGGRRRGGFRWRRGLMRARRGSGAGNTTPTATLGPRAPFRPLPPAVVEADADAVVLGLVQRHLVAEPAFP